MSHPSSSSVSSVSSSSSITWRVLFEDLSGFWCPLSSLFWSGSSYSLVSRHPRSCIEEVDTVYCPQCFTKYPEEEAVLKNKGRCTLCKICVDCESPCIVTTSPDKVVSILKCFYCNWSINCNQIVPSSSSLVPLESEKYVNDVVKFWSSQLSSSSRSASSIGSSNSNMNYQSSSSPASMQFPFSSSAGAEDGLNKLVFVPGVKLKSKNIVRCRKDHEEFSENILVQRKPLPLDGDSSTILHKGKWFMKDQFAIKEIPSIYILPDVGFYSSSAVGHCPGDYIMVRLMNPRSSRMSIKVGVSYNNRNGSDSSSSSTTTKSISDTIMIFDDVLRSVSELVCIPVGSSSSIPGYFIDTILDPFVDELLQSEVDQAAYKKFNPGKCLLVQRSSIPEIISHRLPASSSMMDASGQTDIWTFRNMVEFPLYFPKQSAPQQKAFVVSLSLSIACDQDQCTVNSKICLSS